MAVLWVVAGAVSAVCLFIISLIMRNRRIDRLLRAPVLSAQGQVLFSATQIETLRQVLADTGYAYDWKQNIFYSVLNPWQRKFGYCSLYDETSAPMGMVIDCEPIRFEYGGKRWLIELWKGQYGITVGGEIGVYTAPAGDITVPGLFVGPFYYCAGEEDNLSMTYTLLRGDKVLFQRAARHWWLTGFLLGEYAKPKELVMEASITLKDMEMRDAFLEALRRAGYQQDELRYSGSTVLLNFKKPHTKQPFTRRGLIGSFALHQDRKMVWRYRKLTKGLVNTADILLKLRESAPVLYNLALNVNRHGRQQALYERLQPYLDETPDRL